MGKSEPEVGFLNSQEHWEWRVRVEDLLIYKYLWDYLFRDAAELRADDDRKNDRKALAIVRSHVTQEYLP
jgi:hypothetical protein